ncbi:N-alpha-acetyltransferase 35, NatC auxiliary subunit isoform X1 [Hydra vulgaris]|uniref:N-alpha-acetyltransferase 35, NatC auxiliary subunit isoform X1 n=1 Tax=Hydra vulgaris TaxID=6087 RepID=UPI0006411010|nr:N-alpha-acetyltransferase 35, NatC auxiliary subunit [Hydra vulgaris]
MSITESTGVTFNWVNVRDEFQKSCKELKLGELVHDNLFGLFEAMSAIEIMDPKMDAGMVCNRTRKVYQLQAAITAGKLKVKELTEGEVLGVINELTACFCTWLDGHSLVQTVFTCLYCHNPSVIEDVVLKAFCISTLKMVDIVRNICTRAKVYEEEDFQPLTYGFKLACNVTELRISGMLREADEEITRHLKIYLNDEENSKNEIDICKAIKIRLKFWRALYCALLVFEKQDCSEMKRCKEYLSTAKESLKEMSSTQHLGLKPDNTKENYMLGFDPLVNQRLLPPSFPRQTQIFTQEKFLGYIDSLMTRLLNICSVTECSNFHIILEFQCDFSKQIPCVLSRSILQLVICHPGNKIFGKFPIIDMLKEAVKLFNGTPAVADLTPLSSNEAKVIVGNFFARAVKPMLGLIEAYGHNRARQREKLGILLAEFGALQIEADQADHALHIILQAIDTKRQHLACFESWVLYHSLSIMIQHTFLGFELELFNTHEFHYVYWYLDYLFGWANNCLHRAEMLLNVQEQYIDKKCGKKEKKRKKEIMSSCSDQIKERKSLRLIFNGMKELCLGNIKAYEGFDKDGKIKHPEVFFDNEKIRFERRFMTFQSIDTHQSVQYKDYKDVTSLPDDQFCSSSQLYLKSMMHYQRAMDILQYIEQIDVEGERLMKIAKTNFVVMKLISSGHKQASIKSPIWDFKYHQSYPLIRLV